MPPVLLSALGGPTVAPAPTRHPDDPLPYLLLLRTALPRRHARLLRGRYFTPTRDIVKGEFEIDFQFLFRVLGLAWLVPQSLVVPFCNEVASIPATSFIVKRFLKYGD